MKIPVTYYEEMKNNSIFYVDAELTNIGGQLYKVYTI